MGRPKTPIAAGFGLRLHSLETLRPIDCNLV